MTRGVLLPRCRKRARTWWRHGAIVTVALAWQALTSGPARANDEALAETLFERGRKLMAEGRTAEACAKLHASQRAEPATGTLLNLAVCNETLGKTATAWAQFKEAEAAARADDRPDRVAFARERMARLAPQLAYLTLVVPSASPQGLRLSLDGSPVRAAAWNLAAPIDPGDHTVLADLPNAPQRAFKVGVPGPAAKVSLLIELGPLGATLQPDSVATVEVSEATQGDAPQTVGAAQDSGASNGVRTLAYVSGGVGAGALVAGLGFGLRAYSRWDERNRRCPMDTCSTESGKRAQRSAENAALHANIAVGVGLVALASGVGLYLLGDTFSGDAALGDTAAENEPNPAPYSTWSFAPALARGQMGVVAERSW